MVAFADCIPPVDKLEHGAACAAIGLGLTSLVPADVAQRHPIGVRLVCLSIVACVGSTKEVVDNVFRDGGTAWSRDDSLDCVADLIGGAIGIEIGMRLGLPQRVVFYPRVTPHSAGVVVACTL